MGKTGAARGVGLLRGIGYRRRDRGNVLGAGPPGDQWDDIARIDRDIAVEPGAVIGREPSPICDGAFEILALGRIGASFDIGEANIVGR